MAAMTSVVADERSGGPARAVDAKIAERTQVQALRDSKNDFRSVLKPLNFLSRLTTIW
jgi:hypothetical protein